jgi:hypothetical protein
MGNVNGPMRLRLVDRTGMPHTRTLQVWVHPEAFQKGALHDEEVVNPDHAGTFVSRTSYNQIAYVRVVTGGNQIAKFPVPIQADRDVVIQVGLDAKTEAAGQLQAVHQGLKRQYVDAIEVQNELWNQVSKLIVDRDNDKALIRAREARATLEADLVRLTAKKEAAKKAAGDLISFADCDDDERKLERHKDHVNRRIGELEELARLENTPDKRERKRMILEHSEKIRTAINNDRYDDAIALYEQGVKDFPEVTEFPKQLDDLRKKWAIRSEEHRQARDFIFKEWPNVRTLGDFEAKLPTARLRFKVCADAGDVLTLARLQNSLATLQKTLQDEIKALLSGDADQESRARATKVAEEFDKFSKEVEAAIKAKAGT